MEFATIEMTKKVARTRIGEDCFNLELIGIWHQSKISEDFTCGPNQTIFCLLCTATVIFCSHEQKELIWCVS